MRAAVILALIGMVAGSAVAQTSDDARRTLARAQATGRLATERAARLEAASMAARGEAARARAAAAAVAGQIQSAEADIALAEARIAVVDLLRVQQRARLAAKQGPSVRLIAALQTMSRRPPALSLMQPGSIRDIVHVHAVLAGVLPVMRARTADLQSDVERGRRLRIAADQALGAKRAAQQRLVGQRQRLAALAAAKRATSLTLASSAMAEQDRAIAMGEEARDMTDLIGRIDTTADIRSRLESLAGPVLRPAQPGAQRPLPTEPTAPVAAIPAYRLPVVGTVVTGLGEVSDTGVRARGLTIATRPDAQVVAPTSGRIVFAGVFRGYGNIVVIDHGVGWTTLITNMAMLDVKVGDTVDRGSPIGRTGANRPTVTVELRRRGRPVDIAKLAG
jgi:murein hydrolase activator